MLSLEGQDITVINLGYIMVWGHLTSVTLVGDAATQPHLLWIISTGPCIFFTTLSKFEILGISAELMWYLLTFPSWVLELSHLCFYDGKEISVSKLSFYFCQIKVHLYAGYMYIVHLARVLCYKSLYYTLLGLYQIDKNQRQFTVSIFYKWIFVYKYSNIHLYNSKKKIGKLMN